MKAANEAISTDNPAAVTFDTLTAARELKETGLEGRQAEAIVTTISKAMSGTVATKADIELLGATTKSDIQALSAATKSNIQALSAATKSNIQALGATTKSDIQALRVATKSDMDSFKVEMKADTEALRSEMKADTEALRSEMKAGTEALRSEMKAGTEALRSEMKTELKIFEQSVVSRFEKVDIRFGALEQSLRQEMATLQDKIVIKIGALMVTMTFLLLALGPFYFRWVMSLMGSL